MSTKSYSRKCPGKGGLGCSGVNHTLPIETPFSQVFSHYAWTDFKGGRSAEIEVKNAPSRLKGNGVRLNRYFCASVISTNRDHNL